MTTELQTIKRIALELWYWRSCSYSRVSVEP